MSGDGISELRHDLAEMSKAQAVHHERMENYQERIIDKLGEVAKNSNGHRSVISAPRNGNGGIPASFVLKIVGLLLLAALAIAGGSEGIRAGMHALENVTKAAVTK